MFENKNIEIQTSLSKISSDNFDESIYGKKVELFFIKNNNGLQTCITNYGLRIISLLVPDSNGNIDDVVLGFDSLENYEDKEGRYFGSILGQYANRIEKGKLIIKNEQHQLDINQGENHLHGGYLGFNSVVWDLVSLSDNRIDFHCTFKDGQNGYPGNIEVEVSYELNDANELKISYRATTDKTTVINLSHHSYFNLKGEGNGTIQDHMLTVNADYYTPINNNMIPNEKIESVKGTPFDFRKPKEVFRDYDPSNQQLKISNGYDHNFILNKFPTDNEGLVLAAKLEEEETGRILEVYTNEPGIQIYTGNSLDGSLKGKSEKYYKSYSGICLETQHFPNSPNRADFPSTILQPEDTYRSTTIYKFSTKN